MKHLPFFRHKKQTPAQSMVEFALILPLLLLLVVGLIETGRLMFIYSSVNSATRAAVRYGSATGDNGAGVLRYQDCAGIRTEARRMMFISALADANIVIEYDHGPGEAVYDTCDGAVDNDVDVENGDRITVRIQNYCITPITPIVAPFFNGDDGCAGVNFNGAESSRTYLVSIVIVGTAPPTSGPAPTSFPTSTEAPTATATATQPTPTSSQTPTSSATATVTNTPLAINTALETPTVTFTPLPINTALPTATFTTTPIPATATPTCRLAGLTFTSSGTNAYFDISNLGIIDAYISRVKVQWNATPAQRLESALLRRTQPATPVIPDVSLWTGSNSGYQQTFSVAAGAAPILIGETRQTIFGFKKTYTKSGVECVRVEFSDPQCAPVVYIGSSSSGEYCANP